MINCENIIVVLICGHYVLSATANESTKVRRDLTTHFNPVIKFWLNSFAENYKISILGGLHENKTVKKMGNE